jgi:hypothetical protein
MWGAHDSSFVEDEVSYNDQRTPTGSFNANKNLKPLHLSRKDKP